MPQAMARCDTAGWQELYWRIYLKLKGLGDFLGMDNMGKRDRLNSLPQCRKRICDVAVRHVCTGAEEGKRKHYIHSGREGRGKLSSSLHLSNTEAGYGILETRDYLLTRHGKAKNPCATLPWLLTMT